MASATTRWPWWLVGWFVLSSIVVLWDVGFILMRPESMEGGEWSWIWKPYPNYYRVDKAYGDMSNHWIRTQTYGNILESALNFISVGMYFSSSTWMNKFAPILGMNAAMMTFWKTVLYWGIEIVSGFENTAHNNLFDAVFIFIIPNGFWLVVPFAIILWFAKYFMSLDSTNSSKIKRK